MNSNSQLQSALETYGQEHLLQFWDELSEDEQTLLRRDIDEINLEEVTKFFKQANEGQANQEKLDALLKPVPAELHGSVCRTNSDVLKAYQDEGLKQIADGRVGVLVLAGGQGTRLGVNYPKGMYDVGLPSHKPLFQIQAERILKLQAMAEARYSKSCSITWYIMTSDATMRSTQDFFEKHNHFGLESSNIVMFEQGLMPCFTTEGKIILDKKFRVAKSPDGNGGLYRALRDQGILNDMGQRGINYLHAHSVDNILVRVADPVFIGYCISKGADCAAKVVEKVSPTEAVGVVCDVGGKFQVVEYSEVTLKTAERRNPDGRLTFNAGNICNHFFTTEFLRNVANDFESKLKIHIARKKIPYVNAEGNRITPEKPNGLKIEKFVFDVFPFATNFVTWEVPREEEFSGLKNGENSEKDNPITAKQDIYRLHKTYITSAGGKINGFGPCEVSPLLSYSGEGLTEICQGQTFSTPIHLTAPQESLENGFH